jgi:cell division protein FtsB
MMIRIVAGTLLVALLALQYRLWVSGNGMREVWRLEQAIATQQHENDALAARNRELAAEVRDLKDGHAALEERARTDLGMIGANETFYQVVPPESSNASAQQAAERTAKAGTR